MGENSLPPFSILLALNSHRFHFASTAGSIIYGQLTEIPEISKQIIRYQNGKGDDAAG